MTKGDFERVFVEAINSLRQQVFVPYDTGNLKFQSIKGIWVSDKTFRIYIDEQVAPYMKYTQENWGQFGEPLHGKQNPNEGWFDKAVEYIANYISRRLGGTIER